MSMKWKTTAKTMPLRFQSTGSTANEYIIMYNAMERFIIVHTYLLLNSKFNSRVQLTEYSLDYALKKIWTQFYGIEFRDNSHV